MNKSDLQTVVNGIKKLPEEEALEVSLCLLNLLMELAMESKKVQRLQSIAIVRDQLLNNKD